MNMSYQLTETSERGEAPSSVLVEYTRSGLLEEATEAAARYMNCFIFNQLGSNLNLKYSVLDGIPSIKKYFACKGKEVLKHAEDIIERYNKQADIYLDLVMEHATEDFKKIEGFTKHGLMVMKETLKNIQDFIRKHSKNHGIFSDETFMFLNYPILCSGHASSSGSAREKRTANVWNKIMNRVSERVKLFYLSLNQPATGNDDITGLEVSYRSWKCIFELLTKHCMLDKVLSVFKNYLNGEYVNATESCERRFEENISGLKDRLANSNMSEEEKRFELEKIRTSFFTARRKKTENLVEILDVICNDLKDGILEHLKSWDTDGVDNVTSPYSILITIIENMLKNLYKTSRMTSGVDVDKRPKITFEFKARKPIANLGENEMSCDITFNHTNMPDEEIKINSYPIPYDLTWHMLNKNGFFLNSRTYNDAMKGGLESSAVRSSYLDIVRRIFRYSNFMPRILEEACPEIARKDGLITLENYERFIPLYLYTKLMWEVSVSTVEDAFNYSMPELSKPVIVFTGNSNDATLASRSSRARRVVRENSYLQ